MHKGMTGKNGPASVKKDVTLGDYIERKSKSMEKRIGIQSAAPKKLTFDEWSNLYSEDVENIDFHYAAEVWRLMELAWRAGQENK